MIGIEKERMEREKNGEREREKNEKRSKKAVKDIHCVTIEIEEEDDGEEQEKHLPCSPEYMM